MHKFKKSLGQNFLRDKNILESIINVSKVTSEDSVVEIGPGDGALTANLLKHVSKVTCIELDRDLETALVAKFGENEKFRLIMKDVLKLDFEKEIEGKVKVVANIPYYITSPIINKLIENRKQVKEIFIMIQKEVAERIVSEHDSREYGVLTLAIRYYADAQIMFHIPRTAFYPVPNVDSAFIKITIREDNKYEKLCDEKKFFKYVKASFANRRKNILNNLIMLGFDKNGLKAHLESNNIDINKRAEDFSIDEFIELIDICEKFPKAEERC